MPNAPADFASPLGPIALVGDIASVSTAETTTSTTFTDLATTGPSVTVVTGTRALVIMSCSCYRSSGGVDAEIAVVVSGATTIAVPAGGYGARGGTNNTSYNFHLSRVFVLTGLTAGSNTFKLQYRVPGGGTYGFERRSIAVFVI